jgi:hypothetical protein
LNGLCDLFCAVLKTGLKLKIERWKKGESSKNELFSPSTKSLVAFSREIKLFQNPVNFKPPARQKTEAHYT